jgi:hypothetical protein
MFCDQKCMGEAQNRFHYAECDIQGKSLRKFLIEMPRGVGDPLLTLRAMVEPFRMAGSVERLRELTANSNTDRNVLDFDLSHENDETMDVKHLKILNNLVGLWSEEEIMEIVDNPPKDVLLLEPILRKLFTTDEDFKFMIKFMARFNSIRSCNAIPIGGESVSGCVSGILPFGSSFNHSCDSNVSLVTALGNKIASVVIKPVKKGEQLFISYSSTISAYFEPSTEKRQQEIIQGFQFICSCFACVNNWNQRKILEMPRLERNFDWPPRNIPKNFKDAVEEFKRNCAYIKKNFKHFPSQELYLIMQRNLAVLGIVDGFSSWPIFEI